jgi:signal transduction histidine kinase
VSEQPSAIAPTRQRPPRRRAVDTALLDGADTRRQARGRRVARDLVELSRLQRGYERADAVAVDIGALIGALCAGHAELALSGPAETITRVTDPRRLARVLSALIDNAELHGRPPLSVRYDANEIAVRDHGPGFEPTLLARVTEPFVTGRRASGRGIGLGLAIAARQATLLGAELLLSNASDGGALARLRFARPGDVAAPPA